MNKVFAVLFVLFLLFAFALIWGPQITSTGYSVAKEGAQESENLQPSEMPGLGQHITGLPVADPDQDNK